MSCSESEIEKAERKYELIKKYGSLEEQCAAATDVERAYLKNGSEEQYRRARLTAAVPCSELEVSRMRCRTLPSVC